MKKALVIIDVQNDYFPGGAYPQFEPEKVIEPTLKAINKAQDEDWKIIFVKHEAPAGGFLEKGTPGSEIHEAFSSFVIDENVVVKTQANSFLNTNLDDILQKYGVKELYLTGIMTQNCVTHTAISKEAENYKISVFANACTAPTEMVNNIALMALGDRVEITKI